MSRKLFGNNIPPACQYCSIGKHLPNQSYILCKKHGLVDPLFSCRRFRYDPLKRVPLRKQKPSYSAKDFSLN